MGDATIVARQFGTASGRRRGTTGAAMVEFAICAPIIALLCFAVIDLARVYQLENRLRNAARSGAMFGQTSPYSQATGAGCPDPYNIPYQVWSEAGRTFAVTVAPSEGGCAIPAPGASPPIAIPVGCPIRVTVSQTFVPLTPVLSALIGTPTVKGTVTVKTQGSPPAPGVVTPPCPAI